jgi:membrane associated rhomboid family serine protease
MIQLVVFIIQIIHTLATKDKELNPLFFIGASFWTCQEFGMRMPALIAEGHLHRLFVATFLHYGLCHMLITMILQVAIGTLAESVMGACRFLVFFVLVCLGSNLFGAACTSNYALGADSIVFAYLGSLLTIMMVYWPKLGSPDAIM